MTRTVMYSHTYLDTELHTSLTHLYTLHLKNYPPDQRSATLSPVVSCAFDKKKHTYMEINNGSSLKH